MCVVLFVLAASTKPKIIIHPEIHNDYAEEQKKKSIRNPNEFTLLESPNVYIQNVYFECAAHSFGFEDHEAKFKQTVPLYYLRHLDSTKNWQKLAHFTYFISEFELKNPIPRTVPDWEFHQMFDKSIEYLRGGVMLGIFSRNRTQLEIHEMCEEIKEYYYEQSMIAFGIKHSENEGRMDREKFNCMWMSLSATMMKQRDVLSAKNIAQYYNKHHEKGKDFHVRVGASHLQYLPKMIRQELDRLDHEDVVIQICYDTLNCIMMLILFAFQVWWWILSSISL